MAVKASIIHNVWNLIEYRLTPLAIRYLWGPESRDSAVRFAGPEAALLRKTALRRRITAAAPRSAGIGGRSQRDTRQPAQTTRGGTRRGRRDRSPGTTRTCNGNVTVM